jgi:hypothetical protein
MRDDGKAVGAAVADPPQERPVVEQLGMLAGGLATHPGVEVRLFRRPVLGALAGGGDQRGFAALCPGIAPGGGAPGAQPVGERAFAEHRHQRKQPAGIRFG